MKRNYVLDCTLRDGGYINDWNFGEKAIRKIINGLDNAGVDFIECGFLTSKDYNNEYSLFNNCSQIEPFVSKYMKSIPVAMVALGEKEIESQKIEACDGKSIRGIRLTFHKNEIDRAIEYAKEIQKKGYLLFFQPVGIISYTDNELLKLLDEVNRLNPYAFYIVDTLGTMQENELMQYFYLIDKNLNFDIKLGFHSHNNLQLSFSNAQALLRVYSLRDVIIDASVLGMGRGAGNLCTELITQYINDSIGYKYNVLPLLDIAEKYLDGIRQRNYWGYSMPYFIAAINKCHPNYATYLMNKQTVNIYDIEQIILKLEKSKKIVYDKEYIKKLYDEYQESWVDDKKVIEELKELFGEREILVLAPGKTLVTQQEQIQNYISDNNPFVISVNIQSGLYRDDAIFISNRKRYEKINEVKDALIIASSNIREAKAQANYIVNYSSYTNADKDISDDSGIMLLNLLLACGVKNVYLAGFDGYKALKYDNYFSAEGSLDCDKELYEIKNRKVGAYIKKLQEKISIKYLTETNYYG